MEVSAATTALSGSQLPQRQEQEPRQTVPSAELQPTCNTSDEIWPTETHHLHPFDRMFWQNAPSNMLDGSGARSLAVIVAGHAARNVVDTIVTTWGTERYDWIICTYDAADWWTFAWFANVTVVRVRQQMKFWFYKRLVTPWIMQTYSFVHFLDADVGAHRHYGFDPVGYEAILSAHRIPLAQPALSTATNHLIVRHVRGAHVGRWTDFVECGPFFSVAAHAYRCFWQYMSAHAVSGQGMDLLWCRWLAHACGYAESRTCAIIDRYPVPHLDTKEVRNAVSHAADPMAKIYHEFLMYRAKFHNYAASMHLYDYIRP